MKLHHSDGEAGSCNQLQCCIQNICAMYIVFIFVHHRFLHRKDSYFRVATLHSQYIYIQAHQWPHLFVNALFVMYRIQRCYLAEECFNVSMAGFYSGDAPPAVSIRSFLRGYEISTATRVDWPFEPTATCWPIREALWSGATPTNEFLESAVCKFPFSGDAADRLFLKFQLELKSELCKFSSP